MSLVLSIEKNSRSYPTDLVEEWFGIAESGRILSIKNERRRAESISGLVALKKALGDMGSGSIVRDPNGRPRFADKPGVDFSISHSGILSVAALTDSPSGRVGVDIERVEADEKKEDTHRRIADRYFSAEEKLCFSALQTSVEFYRIWTAKEARSKLTGIGLAALLSLEQEDKTSRNEEYLYKHFLLNYENEKYVLTVCTNVDEKINFACGDDIEITPLTPQTHSKGETL